MEPLASLSVSKLKSLARYKGISLAGCSEKQDIVDALLKAGVPNEVPKEDAPAPQAPAPEPLPEGYVRGQSIVAAKDLILGGGNVLVKMGDKGTCVGPSTSADQRRINVKWDSRRDGKIGNVNVLPKEITTEDKLTIEQRKEVLKNLDRAGLKKKLFASYDLDGDGHLVSGEMMKFAACMGFDGSEEEWGPEYERICSDLGADREKGISLSVFLPFVDDESENGCYFSDEELMEMLEAIIDKDAEPEEKPWEPKCLLSREELKKKLFELYDEDHDGALQEHEMLMFAKRVGFDGPPQDFTPEYKRICSSNECDPETGVSEVVIMKLLDDESDDGCYFSDIEIAHILIESGVKVPMEAPPVPEGGDPSDAPVDQFDFKLGDKVKVRDSKKEEWKFGVVTSVLPLKVKPFGWGDGCDWKMVTKEKQIEDISEVEVGAKVQIMHDSQVIVEACVAAGLSAEVWESAWTQAAGKMAEVLQKDDDNKQVKLQVPDVKDCWFALAALAKREEPEKDPEEKRPAPNSGAVVAPRKKSKIVKPLAKQKEEAEQREAIEKEAAEKLAREVAAKAKADAVREAGGVAEDSDPEAPPEDFSKMSVGELKSLAKERKVNISTCSEKSDLVNALKDASEKAKAERQSKRKADGEAAQPPPEKKTKKEFVNTTGLSMERFEEDEETVKLAEFNLAGDWHVISETLGMTRLHEIVEITDEDIKQAKLKPLHAKRALKAHAALTLKAREEEIEKEKAAKEAAEAEAKAKVEEELNKKPPRDMKFFDAYEEYCDDFVAGDIWEVDTAFALWKHESGRQKVAGFLVTGMQKPIIEILERGMRRIYVRGTGRVRWKQGWLELQLLTDKVNGDLLMRRIGNINDAPA